MLLTDSPYWLLLPLPFPLLGQNSTNKKNGKMGKNEKENRKTKRYETMPANWWTKFGFPWASAAGKCIQVESFFQFVWNTWHNFWVGYSKVSPTYGNWGIQSSLIARIFNATMENFRNLFIIQEFYANSAGILVS